uniref:Uncharacterized protein n=1 Tax=Candidatus Kentrum sp. LFY TaxID=2126342 RepID=A0A450WV89_9GAMM|nr:MAG: hypothetical protein BECKLFY1418C_GA0070996_10827 [Candidatus Kentron sp. LFY]
MDFDIEGMERTVWFGLGLLPLHLEGRMRWNQNSIGARVAGEGYAGAFYRTVHDKGSEVWIGCHWCERRVVTNGRILPGKFRLYTIFLFQDFRVNHCFLPSR